MAMDAEATQVLTGVLVAFTAALVGGEIAQRLKMPSVVGQIGAGVAVGPFALGWLQESAPLALLSELGVILLLFAVGLETKVADLKRVGSSAISVGVLGVIFPFLIGGAWAVWSGNPTPTAMFIGAAFVATSAGITAKVLQEYGALGRKESRIILGAAIIDDILAMLLLAVVSGMQDGPVNVVQITQVLLVSLLFVGAVAIIGSKVMKGSENLLDAPVDGDSPLILSLAICLGLALASAVIGMAAIIGAFLAGMILAETKHRHRLELDTRPILAFFVPFFFVVTGSQVNVQELGSAAMIGTVLLITVLAVISKFVGGALGARKLGRQGAAIVGMGMVPRGEVGIIVASMGLSHGVFNNSIYSAIIAMSLLTSIIAPPFLKKMLASAPPNPDDQTWAAEEMDRVAEQSESTRTS